MAGKPAELAMLLTLKDEAGKGFAGAAQEANRFVSSLKSAFAGLVAVDLFEGIKSGISSVVSSAIEAADGVGRLQGKLGLTREEAEQLGQVAQNVFRNNFGSDMGEVNSTIASIRRNLGDLGPELTQTIAQGVLTITDAFDASEQDVTRAVSTMVRNFEGLSETDALDLITRGFQGAGDKGGELLDTLNEYSPQFAKLGISGPQAMGLLNAGLEAGAFSADKVGDAVKEFSIRAIDGTKATKQAYADLGLDADEMAAKIAAGGPQAQQAFGQVLSALQGIADPVAQNAAGVALFGTQWEDLGPKAVLAMQQGMQGLTDYQGATQKAADAMAQGIGPAIEAMKRQLIGLGVDALAPLMPMLTAFVTAITSGVQAAIPVIREIGAALATVFGGGGSMDDLMEASLLLANFLPLDVASEIVNTVNMLGGVFEAIFQGDLPMALEFAQRTVEGFGNLIVTSVEHWASAFADWVGVASPGMLDGLADMATELGAWILETAFAIVEQLATWAAAFVDWIGPQVPDMLRALGSYVAEITGWILGTGLPMLVAKLAEWGEAFVAWIQPRIPPMLAALGELAGELGVWIVSTALPAITSKLLEWGQAFIAWVAPRIPGMLAELLLLQGRITTWIITEALPAIVGQLVAWGDAFTAWIAKDALPALPGKLAQLLSTITGWIAGAAGELGAAAAAIGRSVVDGVVTAINAGVSRVSSAIVNLISAGLAAGRQDNEVRSPSAKWARELGAPLIEGMALGMISRADLAAQAAMAIAEAARQQAMAVARGAGPGNSGQWAAAMSQLGASIGVGLTPVTRQFGPLPSGSIIPGLNNTPSGSIPIGPGTVKVDVYVGQRAIDDMWVETRERVERQGR